ncbi:MAG TPA: hypothetical protein VFQ61_02095 [Polyangiaceae bacterium]|nr:hypothetical protein [Polyangiaceae bacterium]
MKEASSYPAGHNELLEACRRRERESCHYLAKLELDGAFGSRDERAAAEHFWQACAYNWGPSCSALAYMRAKGVGLSPDAGKAAEFGARACALGHEASCKVLRHGSSDFPPP